MFLWFELFPLVVQFYWVDGLFFLLTLNLEVLHILKLCLIFVGPTLCQFSKYKKMLLYCTFIFSIKPKIILIPQARNSTTESADINVDQPKILVSLPKSFQLVLRNCNGVFQNNPTDNFLASRSSQRPLQVKKTINIVSSSRHSFRS